MEFTIKKIKEYIKDGPPQFDILERGKVGEDAHIEIASTNPGVDMYYKEIISPKTKRHGFIRKVKRIKDDKVFGIYSYVIADGSSSFIIQFSEDLIHCYVIEAFGKNSMKKEISINDISFEESYNVESVIDIEDEGDYPAPSDEDDGLGPALDEEDDNFEGDPIEEW